MLQAEAQHSRAASARQGREPALRSARKHQCPAGRALIPQPHPTPRDFERVGPYPLLRGRYFGVFN